MKKRLLAATIAATLTLVGGTALANPVELEGSTSVQFRQDNTSNLDENGIPYNEKTSGIKQTVILKAKTKLGENLDLYARIGVQGGKQLGFMDSFKQDEKVVGGVDQFGLVYENLGFTYKLGRQDITIGATNLLYANYANVGKNVFVDGLSVAGKCGEIYFNVLAAKEDNIGAKNKLYTAHLSYSPNETWTFGSTFAKFDNGNYVDPSINTDEDWRHYSPSSKHWAVDAAYTNGKAVFSGEYTKSDAAVGNKAYDIGAYYSFDDQNSLYVAYYRVEQFGSIHEQTDFWSNEKGLLYTYDRRFTENTSLNISYKDGKKLDSNAKSTSLKATVNYTF